MIEAQMQILHLIIQQLKFSIYHTSIIITPHI
jgi:hypothetical protein